MTPKFVHCSRTRYVLESNGIHEESILALGSRVQQSNSAHSASVGEVVTIWVTRTGKRSMICRPRNVCILLDALTPSMRATDVVIV